MTAAAPAIIPDLDDQPRPRLRLIALALAGWHDHVPMPADSCPGESGAGEPDPAWFTSDERKARANRRRDALLLKLERPTDGAPIPLDAYRGDRRPGDLQRGTHPCWDELSRAMTALHSIDPDAHRLVVETLVADPLPGVDRGAATVAAIHALPFISGGRLRAVSVPRYRLMRALMFLDEQLPTNLAFPREVHDQIQGWKDWLFAMKKAGSEFQTRSDGYRKASKMRDKHVRELADLAGWSQVRIARELGVSQQAVSKALKRTEREEA